MNKLTLSAAALLLSASLGTLLAGTALAGGAAAPVPGGGQVQAATPETVAAGLRAAGYQVTVNPAQADEDPSLSVVAGDYELDVWFSGCQAGRCDRVTASTGWELGEDKADLEFLNEWNGNYFTQAYVYEDSYYLDSTLTLRGGYTRAALQAWMSDFLTDVADFGAELP
jgi:hypothetical protein